MASLPKINPAIAKLEPSILKTLFEDFVENNQAALDARDGEGNKITAETLQEWAQSEDKLSQYSEIMSQNSAYRMAYAIVKAVFNSTEGGGYYPGYYKDGFFYQTFIQFPTYGQKAYQDPYTPQSGKVYVDIRDGGIYIWNKTTSSYFSIGGKGGSGGGGGSIAAQLYSAWTDSSPVSQTYALDAALGWELHNTKVDKVEGKGLSTNDYDNIEKGKVADAYTLRHSHSNKALLDSYTHTNAEIGTAITLSATAIQGVKVDGTDLTKDGDNKVSIPNADATHTGLVTATQQEFGGDKVFHGNVSSLLGVSAKGIVDLNVTGGGGGSEIVLYSVWTQARPDSLTYALDAALGWDLYHGKVDKEQGKGLSTNDYDNVEKNKVASAYAVAHSHSNKALLDGYTYTNEEIGQAIAHQGDGIKGVKVDGVDLEKDGDNKVSIPNADATHTGLITAIAQHIGGDKTFHGNINSLQGVSAKGIVDLNVTGGGGGSDIDLYSAWTQARPELAIYALDAALGWDLYHGKVDKVAGKGLSTYDYNSEEKGKVNDAYTLKHSHTNKELLDGYTHSNAEIGAAITKSASAIQGVKVDGVDLEKDGNNKVSIPNADTTHTGLMTASQQELGGDKTFHGNVSSLQGVSAKGIVDLNVSGGGGGSSVTVIEDANLDADAGEDDTEVATAYAVARLKDQLSIDSLPEFSTSTAYQRGDSVRYQGRGWLFHTDKAAGAWSYSYVDKITLKRLVSPLKILNGAINTICQI